MARRIRGAGDLADMLLAALIVGAPLAAGSWKLQVLPVLMLLAVVAWTSTIASSARRGSSVRVGLLYVVLSAFAAYTALQAVTLPQSILAALSPHANQLQVATAGTTGGGPLSYEPGATWREAAKLVLYALVAQIAQERSRVQGVRPRVAIPILWAGLAAAAIALVHRALGIRRLFGLIDTLTSPQEMTTTFANPNHAAGFMALVTLTGIGLGLSARGSRERTVYLLLAVASAYASVSSASKGGIGALAIGLAVFVAGMLVRRDRRRLGPLPVVIAVASIIGVLVALWNVNALVDLLEPQGHQDSWGLVEKSAAMKDAIPMIGGHWPTGIGRGAYVSVYTLYKTSPLQLTFAFPENIAVQLLSEWGVVAGGVALVALVVAVLRRLWRAPNPTTLGLMCGVAALVVQNLVDFSLELPGVAVPVAAAMGSASSDWRGLRLNGGRTYWLLIVFVPLFGIFATSMAFLRGDLALDTHRLQAYVSAASNNDTVPHDPTVETLVARHPASAMMSAQAAYLAELQEPPDMHAALRYANQTLYLAPTYAGGHLVAGRLLIRLGRRAQGFTELRTAWRLAGPDLLTLMDHVIQLAHTPEEVARAIPRRVDELDLISERELSRIVRRLASLGRLDWAKHLLRQNLTLDEAPQEDLYAIVLAADAATLPDVALAAASRRLGAHPEDVQTRMVTARIELRRGNAAAARELLDGLRVDGPDMLLMLELRLRMEIDARDLAAAQETLKALRARVMNTRDEIKLATFEAELLQKTGDPLRALQTLDQALDRWPNDIELRVYRAEVLLDQNLTQAALSDLEFVLHRSPNHARAIHLTEIMKQGNRR